MTQQQGSSSTNEGRLGGKIGTSIVAGDIALGVGWGSTASVAVRAGSNDQRGEFTITTAGSGLAQATATVLLTFHDGAYEGTVPPVAMVRLIDNSQAVTEQQPTGAVISTTTMGFTHPVLPVVAKTYRFAYIVVA